MKISAVILSVFSLFFFASSVYAASNPERVSVATDGTQTNSYSGRMALSSNGRYVAFESNASNLVPGDTNNVSDIFVHDRQTGMTERVSVASDGTEANNYSQTPSISADGRYVAFTSLASNLIAKDVDTNMEVYVHDRQTGVTERVSVPSDGTHADNSSRNGVISGDGRYVAFISPASNLVPNDTNNGNDVFVHDRQTGVTERVSISSDGTQIIRAYTEYPSISNDGRYVAFETSAPDLVPGDTNGVVDTFVHDRQTGTTEIVSNAYDGSPSNGNNIMYPSISGNGRYVMFDSGATNLIPGLTNNTLNIFVHDRQNNTTDIVTVSSDGTQANGPSTDKYSSVRRISDDGRYVVFGSFATNLVPGDTNNSFDTFIHDRQTGMTERADTNAAGVQITGFSNSTNISPDGAIVGFATTDPNLVANDTNNQQDIFVTANPLTGDTTAPSIVITAPSGTISANTTPITVSVTDASGVASKTYKVDNTAIANTATSLDLTYYTPGQHTFSVTAVDSFGNQGTASSQFVYSPTTTSITGSIDEMYTNGDITQLGNSLYSKLNQAQSYIAAGNYAQAKSTLQSLRNQVQAQIDIHITAYAGNLLLAQIDYLINTLP